MIVSFKSASTEQLWETGKHRSFPANIHRTAWRKLAMVEAAAELSDLFIPPGNHLEALKGDRVGQHSIRVNSQYRVCFRWHEGNAHDVEIVDYHR